MDIKAIIWDWGRTLYDSDNKIELPESPEVLQYCKTRGYRMILVSKVSPDAGADIPERTQQIETSPLRNFFEIFFVTDQEKTESLEKSVKHFGLPRNQILLIGDRTKREITYANKYGHPSIWIKKGKFAQELPNEETGQPTFIVISLAEIIKLL